ncbi:MAG: hypothetical protein RLZZ495_369 [Pseudomonadota bacterium]
MSHSQLDFFAQEDPAAQALTQPKRRTSTVRRRVVDPLAVAAAAEPVVAPEAVPAVAAVAAVAATPATVSTTTLSRSEALETMALQLEADIDYRVLRRLKPCLEWPLANPLNAPFSSPQSICHVVILDLETTGLDHHKDRLMEMALLRVNVDVATGMPVGVVQVYDGLEDPGIPIPSEVQELTGIIPNMVQGQRLDEKRIAELLQGVHLVIAHNAGFDRPFAEARIPRFRELAWACSVVEIPWKMQGYRSAALESLALDWGWFYDAHRAEMDCHALLAVLAKPLPQTDITGLGHLLDQLHHPAYNVSATNAPFDAKDKLKMRGYRWSAEKKVWHTFILGAENLHAELDWLKAHIYLFRSAVVQVERLDARVRYSGRSGELQYHPL